jgi:hypothetical protein
MWAEGLERERSLWPGGNESPIYSSQAARWMIVAQGGKGRQRWMGEKNNNRKKERVRVSC